MESLSSEQNETRRFEQGKLLQISFDEYKAAEGINSHGLMDILRSPEHYYEHRYKRIEEKKTDALEFGRLFHFAILEPEYFRNNFVIEPKFLGKTKDGRESAQSAEAKQMKKDWFSDLKPGTLVIPEKWCEALLRMSDKMLAHPLTKGILAKGVREASIFWKDPETGEDCKGRLDFISEAGWIVDLKTARDARYEQFSRDIMKLWYHLQAATYCQAGQVTGCFRGDSFIHLVIEKEPPYGIAVYPAGASVRGIGDQWRSKAMKIYAKCRKTGIYPGYNHEARTMELPQWAEAVPIDEEEENG